MTPDKQAILNKAKENLEAAQLLVDQGFSSIAASRTYYAICPKYSSVGGDCFTSLLRQSINVLCFTNKPDLRIPAMPVNLDHLPH